jgi:hypothetical protein
VQQPEKKSKEERDETKNAKAKIKQKKVMSGVLSHLDGLTAIY